MIRLITSWYPEADEVRRSEILECLQRNVDNDSISEVCLLLENATAPFANDKIRTRDISSRPTYNEMFEWARSLVSSDDDITLIANSDIFFDRDIGILNHLDLNNRCLALSRWDVQVDGSAKLFERGDSQDCWVFAGTIRETDGSFPIGVYDCDNKIAWELRESGYEVINPAFSVKSFHLHQTEVRSYDPSAPTDHGIRPPYLYVEPDNIAGLIDCWRLRKRAGLSCLPWRLTMQKLMRTVPGRLFQRVNNKIRRTLS